MVMLDVALFDRLVTIPDGTYSNPVMFVHTVSGGGNLGTSNIGLEYRLIRNT
jgi:hypothetical protein